MNKASQSIIITLMNAMIPPFSSRSDDDSVNEWDMSYASLLSVDYLRPTPPFILKHVKEEGTEGSVEFQFIATTQKVAAQDTNVDINVTCDGISADKINSTSKTAAIKADATASEPITLSITDWDELESTKGEANHTLRIKVTGIGSTATDVANTAYYQEIVPKTSRSAERKKENVLLTDAKDWIFTFMEGVEDPESNSVAGIGSGDIATNGIPFRLTVDLRTVRILIGIQTRYWGAGYASHESRDIHV